MVRIAAHAGTCYRQMPVARRIEKIRQAGYDAVEFWFLNGSEVKEAAAACRAHGVDVADFVLNSPDGTMNGSLVNPAHRQTYLEALKKAAEAAHILLCSGLITCTGNEIPGVPRDAQRGAIVEKLAQAVRIDEEEQITLLLEPLNTVVDHPGYFLSSSAEGFEIVRCVGSPRLRLLYYIYHMQIMEVNLCDTIRNNIDLIGHFHAAGVPGRHEVFLGEVNYPFLMVQINEAGYSGFFGLEYGPTLPDNDSLRLTREWLLSDASSSPRRQS